MQERLNSSVILLTAFMINSVTILVGFYGLCNKSVSDTIITSEKWTEFKLVVHPYESNGSNHVFIQIIVFQIISFSIFFIQGRSNPQKYLTPTEMITSMEMLQKQLRDSASS